VDGLTYQDLDLSNRQDIDSYFKDKDLNYDAFIHCAAINNPKKIEDINYEDLDKTIEVNLLCFYKIIQLLLPEMKKNNKGYILGFSSIYGVISRAKRLPYSISKHGMLGLVKTLSLELGEHSILVNAISPGFGDTQLTRKNLSQKEIDNLAKKIPLRRLAQPSEIAKVAYFLCSEDNSYITGQNIIVDGGYIVGGFQR
jgi:3-oxoacyl-[acyl-carrier protein] reductase